MRQGTGRARGILALILFTFVLLVFSGSSPGRVLAQQGGTTAQAPPGAPKLDAASWALVDQKTGIYLAGKDPDKRVAIASTAKIMAALVTLDEGRNLNQEVTVSENAASYAGGVYSSIGLYPYDRVSVRELLEATLIPSGTDAVYALAEYLGGGSASEFVGKMNARAKSMGLKNTHFVDPAGLNPSKDYSSARDLAKIARAAMKYKVFRDIVDTPQGSITTQDRTIRFVNTNLLIVPNSGYQYGPATGIKTGTLPQSGPCLVASASAGGESYIAVILDAAGDLQRFESARAALEYGFGSFGQKPLVHKGERLRRLDLPYRRGKSVPLVAQKSVSGFDGPGLKVESRVTAGKAPPSAKTGQKLGAVKVSVDGHAAGSTPLVVAKGYGQAGLWQKLRYWTSGAAQGITNWVNKKASG